MTHPQEAQSDPHDGGFVQVGGDSAGEGQGPGELIKHLGLLTPPASGCVTRTQLPLLRTGPAGGRGAADQRRREGKEREECGS